MWVVGGEWYGVSGGWCVVGVKYVGFYVGFYREMSSGCVWMYGTIYLKGLVIGRD